MNKIIYPFIFAALSMMVASCSQNVKINVNFADHSFDGKKAYLTVYDSGDTVDSVVVNEKFVAFEENVDTAFFARLIVDGNRFGFIVEPGEINVEWGKDDIIARGTPLNDKLNNVNRQLDKLDEQWEQIGVKLQSEQISEDDAEQLNTQLESQQLGIFHRCYEENSDNAIGAWAFTNYLSYGQFSLKQIDSIFATAPKPLLNLKRVKKAKADAQAVENTAVGKKFVDFTLRSPQGTTVKLSDYVGKNGDYTLVDFWASWCMPCRKEIEGTLTHIYEKYNGKGLNIVGVAVWDKPADTQQAIKDLSIPWTVILADSYTTVPTDLYGIAGIPHIMLIDSSGTIVMRGLQGDELLKAVDNAMKAK